MTRRPWNYTDPPPVGIRVEVKLQYPLTAIYGDRVPQLGWVVMQPSAVVAWRLAKEGK